MPDQPDDDIAPEVDQIRDILLSPDTLIHRISLVISEILEQKIHDSHDELAKSFAPIISEAIRYQVYQARADIVDAMYPIIGQAINKAMREAVRDLAQDIDSRLRRNTNPNTVARRFKARVQGISDAEFRMREALPFGVQEVFLIHKESGLLIHHYSRNVEGNEDRDLVSGMLTAIRDFAREAFGRGDSGELGAIEYEDRQILLEASGAAYLAVVVDGVEPAGFRERMREALIEVHEKNYEGLKHFDGSDEDLNNSVATSMTKTFEKPPDYAQNQDFSSRQKIIVSLGIILLTILLCLPFVGVGVWIKSVESRLITMATINQAQPPPEFIVVTATPTATPTDTPTVTPIPPSVTPRPTDTETPAPTETPTPLMIIATATRINELPGVVSARILNLRSKPGLESDVLLTLSYGDQLTGISRSADNEWVYIYTWAGIAGWTYAPYIQWSGDIETLPITEGISE